MLEKLFGKFNMVGFFFLDWNSDDGFVFSYSFWYFSLKPEKQAVQVVAHCNCRVESVYF